MKLTSPVFEHNGKIPVEYTCDGNEINPPLEISGVPEIAKSLVIIMHDPDIPKEITKKTGISGWTHWVVFNMDPSLREIAEGDVIGTEGKNDSGSIGYAGPCPPPQFEPKKHRYFFELYALDCFLDLNEGADRKQVEKAMKDHIIERDVLIGTYSR